MKRHFSNLIFVVSLAVVFGSIPFIVSRAAEKDFDPAFKVFLPALMNYVSERRPVLPPPIATPTFTPTLPPTIVPGPPPTDPSDSGGGTGGRPTPSPAPTFTPAPTATSAPVRERDRYISDRADFYTWCELQGISCLRRETDPVSKYFYDYQSIRAVVYFVERDPVSGIGEYFVFGRSGCLHDGLYCAEISVNYAEIWRDIEDPASSDTIDVADIWLVSLGSNLAEIEVNVISFYDCEVVERSGVGFICESRSE